jgi:cytochrome c551/c552
MAMTRAAAVAGRAAGLAVLALMATPGASAAADPQATQPAFQTSDRCVACHNGMLTASGQDYSIGFDWRTTMMANSSRDPYWQAGVRRESVDHPEAQAAIEDECSICHMPITRYGAKVRGHEGKVFAHLPFAADAAEGRQAADGVSCSVCHQISKQRLGTPESFVGGFVVAPPRADGLRPEYGPYPIETGQARIMRSSSEGYHPEQSDHIRSSELCATCHTLITKALGPGGTEIGRLPEQVPFQEWLHSDYKDQRSCQSCHMPEVSEPTPITRVFGVLRRNAARHTFVGGNFFMQRVLTQYRDDLGVAALPHELSAAAEATVGYLETQAARLTLSGVRITGGRLQADVSIENLGGHKLPTAYPSRRAWIHFIVRDRNGAVVFESGALHPDGSIQGNDNDDDATRFEPHYAEVTRPDQVEIYESILGGPSGEVTTGLLTGVRYLKDNRLLPTGFDKRTAEPDIAVIGRAMDDESFTGGGDRVRYTVTLPDSGGPFAVVAELLYQPVGYRWANNLKAYSSHAEPARFTRYYDALSGMSAVILAHASGTARE